MVKSASSYPPIRIGKMQVQQMSVNMVSRMGFERQTAWDGCGAERNAASRTTQPRKTHRTVGVCRRFSPRRSCAVESGVGDMRWLVSFCAGLGAILDAALGNLAMRARVVCCGAISIYNGQDD